MKCLDCEAEFESRSQLANHIRWHHKRSASQKQCAHCFRLVEVPNLESHERKCLSKRPYLICGKKTNNSSYCSKSCATVGNNRNGSIGYSVYRKRNGIARRKTYRDICFEHWDHKFALCNWDLCLDVHHIDDNHKNNEPRNLIPLCQNHHTLTRMFEHRDKIGQEIDQIIISKCGAVA